MNDIIVIGAAVIQVALIASVFMGLWYGKPAYSMVFLAGLLFIFLFFALTFSDTLFRGEVDKLEAMRPIPGGKSVTP